MDYSRGRAGREYYSSICMRAVNQSIGRSIRHAGDYASILLVDERYRDEQVGEFGLILLLICCFYYRYFNFCLPTINGIADVCSSWCIQQYSTKRSYLLVFFLLCPPLLCRCQGVYVCMYVLHEYAQPVQKLFQKPAYRCRPAYPLPIGPDYRFPIHHQHMYSMYVAHYFVGYLFLSVIFRPWFSSKKHARIDRGAESPPSKRKSVQCRSCSPEGKRPSVRGT